MNQSKFTHLDDHGRAHMVDVSDRAVTTRTATATGFVSLSAEVVAMLRSDTLPKGDALSVARVAGIMATKRTPDLIPLCHPIAISGASVYLQLEEDGVRITATVGTTDRTGVEMEALTAVTVAALTVVDMVKALDPNACITDVGVSEKDGGKNGRWVRS